MQDKVRTRDYLKYLENRLEYWTKKNLEVTEAYIVCKNKYERKFLSQIFKKKYEDSFEGDKSWMGCWDFHTSNITTCQEEIQRCLYRMKIDEFYTSIGDKFSSVGFYKWCQANEIPY